MGTGYVTNINIQNTNAQQPMMVQGQPMGQGQPMMKQPMVQGQPMGHGQPMMNQSMVQG